MNQNSPTKTANFENKTNAGTNALPVDLNDQSFNKLYRALNNARSRSREKLSVIKAKRI